ncbi:MAG: hypothetical protein U0R80_19885 [Nocardioidaceae bacterium]
MTTLRVPARFRGPASSGNGGWTAGALAGLVSGTGEYGAALADAAPVEVTLRRPPPLDTDLEILARDGTLVAGDDQGPVAEARAVDRSLLAVAPVPAHEAAAAEASYAGLRGHPFPTCFACGTGRDPGDGLRVFPGPVGPGRVAATWTPDGSVAGAEAGLADLAVTWAALDCTGGWSSDLEERPMVLGRMTARVDRLPAVGDLHVVVGEALGTDGRKTFTASTLYDAAGDPLARAEHVWIAVDPRTFGRPGPSA